MLMPTLYGINNCDTVKKARRWLETHGVEYRFHDVRSDGLTPALLHRWSQGLGWETLLNRRGTTWRRLPDKDKEVSSEAHATALMLSHPTLIKRPVLEVGKTILIGFDAGRYGELLKR